MGHSPATSAGLVAALLALAPGCPFRGRKADRVISANGREPGGSARAGR